MNKTVKVLLKISEGITAAAAIAGIVAFVKERFDEKEQKPCPHHQGTYEQFVKRPLDAFLATGALLVFSPVLAVTALLVKIKLGSPVLFTQERPGKDEKIFKLYKFRTMTDERDEKGELLPDEVRLTSFGKLLRSTSLDELPELLNIIRGDMAIVGPRPQLVRDMVFMTSEQRKRHSVRPGLSGLAQVNGRNDISWEDKFDWDLKYIENIKFSMDAKLILQTFHKTSAQEGITDGENATALDFGDALLKEQKITQEQYDTGQMEAMRLLEES